MKIAAVHKRTGNSARPNFVFSLCLIPVFAAFFLLTAHLSVANAAMTNTATVSGTPRAGTLTPAQDTESVDLIDRAPALTVTKSADVASVNAAGDPIVYTITVTNSGNTTVTAITVSDPLGTPVCSISGNATIATLAPTASDTCTFTYNATQADFDTEGGGDGDIDNTATANGTANAPGLPLSPVAVSDSGSASVTLNLNPALTVTKAGTIGGSPVNGTTDNAPVGTIVTYTYVVTNTGNQTISNVSLSDAHNGSGPNPSPNADTATLTDNLPLGGSSNPTTGDNDWDALAPGDVLTVTATYTITQNDVDTKQ